MQNGDRALVLEARRFDEVRHEIALGDGSQGSYAPVSRLDEPKVELTLDVPGKPLYVHAIRPASAPIDLVAGPVRAAAALTASFRGAAA
jgi:hypothetical protein